MEIKIEIQDNIDAFKREFEEKLKTALEAVGLQAEGNAKLEIANMPPRVDSGHLRDSITHKVKQDENAVYIGNNTYYAIYVHEGTGKYATEGSTGDGWWVYVKGSTSSKISAHGKRYTEAQARRVVAYLRSKGLDAHMTQGMKPNRFLTNAMEKHRDEYKKIIETILKS